MSLILIHGDRFSGERELAHSLAEHLGCRLLTRDVVIERAAAWGGLRKELVRILTESPRWFDRFLSRTRTHLLLLRAAVAEEIRDGDGVCYGEVADLLLKEDVPLIRVRALASEASRIRSASWLLKFSGREAVGCLERTDRARKGRLRLIYGCERSEPAPDLVIDTDRTALPDACDTVATLVRSRSAQACCGFGEARLEDFALSSRVSAALAADPATAHLNLSVESARGCVAITGRVREAQDLEEVNRVASRVQGVSEVTFNGEQLGIAGLRQVIADHGRFVWGRPRPAAVVSGTVLVLVLILFSLAGRFGSFVEQAASFRSGHRSVTITGIVTDSRCGARHLKADSAQCVRACVAQGAKYVLENGKTLYQLSDPRGADRYAAREVKVIGVLEDGARNLKIKSIEPL